MVGRTGVLLRWSAAVRRASGRAHPPSSCDGRAGVQRIVCGSRARRGEPRREATARDASRRQSGNSGVFGLSALSQENDLTFARKRQKKIGHF